MIWLTCAFFLSFFHSLKTYVKAVNSGIENIQEALLSPEAQKQLAPTGPRLIHHSTKARKTIDTEDTDLKYSAQPDGTLGILDLFSICCIELHVKPDF